MNKAMRHCQLAERKTENEIQKHWNVWKKKWMNGWKGRKSRMDGSNCIQHNDGESLQKKEEREAKKRCKITIYLCVCGWTRVEWGKRTSKKMSTIDQGTIYVVRFLLTFSIRSIHSRHDTEYAFFYFSLSLFVGAALVVDLLLMMLRLIEQSDIHKHTLAHIVQPQADMQIATILRKEKSSITNCACGFSRLASRNEWFQLPK